MSGKWFTAPLLATVVVAWAGACSGQGDPAPPSPAPSAVSGYERPANVHWVEHWNPTSAVDLNRADGTFIRAFDEAQEIASISGSTATGSFPGFAAADRSRRNPRFYSHGMTWEVNYGYTTRAVLRFERRSPTTATATICAWVNVNPFNADEPDHRIEYLTYQRTGTPPPVNQRGPRHAPTGNVFGQWYAIRDDWDIDQENTMCNSTPINRDRTPTPGWPLHGNDDL